MYKVCVPLADGFEEIEAITLIDILRRANIEVIVTGVGINEMFFAEGSHGVKVLIEKNIKNVKVEDIDLIALPGGLPGATNLAKNELLQTLLKEMDKKDKYICAICAAPYALKTAGVLKNKYTAYPGWEANIKHTGYIDDKKIIEDHNILTSQGPGTAMCFALEIVKKLEGEEKYQNLKEDLLADFC